MSLPVSDIDKIWLGVGMLGQMMFFMRFFFQWIASEKAKRSTVPDIFWYFSLGGGIILLSYALYKQDIVFIIGQMGGVMIYTRNLYLIRTHKARVDDPLTDPAADAGDKV